VEEETAHPTHKGTVDSGCGATKESPSVFSEVGHRWVGVVKIREHHNPVVGEDIRNEVVLHESCDAGIVCPPGEKG
jgi:hypothetical protein